jgi:predicted 3-demethylubiquinone-9 3-methyltransferase (glyoxalase superfamily)
MKEMQMSDHDKIAPLLMFAGQAEEAIAFYIGLFDDSDLLFMQKYGPEYPGGPEGQVVHARFTLNGKLFMAMDSAVEQPFTFTPSISFFVNCADEAEIDRLFAALSEGGVLMPLDTYPFATRYAWVHDRFGVSWQLNLQQATT